MSKKTPWMPIYGQDFFFSTFVRTLPPAVRSYYLELLWHQWDSGGLPANPADLRLLLGVTPEDWAQAWPRLATRFTIAPDGQRRNLRLEEIREEWAEYRAAKVAAGLKSVSGAHRAGGRFTNRPPTDSPTAHQPSVSTSTSTPASKSTSREVKGIAPAARARFAPPTLAELSEHLRERRSPVDPEAFIAHYESQGWMVGKRPMKNWKAAVVTWEKNDMGGGRNGANQPSRARKVMEFGLKLKAEEEARGQG